MADDNVPLYGKTAWFSSTRGTAVVKVFNNKIPIPAVV